MAEWKLKNGLKEPHKIFCREYIYDYNGTRAYQKAFPGTSDLSARTSASNLLTNSYIKDYIKELQEDVAKQIGVSAIMLGSELKKIAMSNIAMLHKDWLTREEFELLGDDIKASIQEIDTKILKKNIGTAKDPDIVDVEYIKVKLFDKVRAIDSLKKMLGFDEPEKVQHSGSVEQVQIYLPDNKRDKK